MFEDYAVATFGIAPRDCAVFIANHVTRAALEALLVVEQDAAVVCRDEELGRARDYAGLGGTASAYVGIHHDVRSVGDPEIDGLHTIVETDLCAANHNCTLVSATTYRKVSGVWTGSVGLPPWDPTSRCACPTALS